MKVGSLCSGIGGLELGLEAHGMTTVWQSEVDPYAAAQLARHWDVPNHGDLTMTDWTRVEPVDLVCVGYPCQPFSHAGRRRGTDDERHLWPHIRDALRVLRPRYVFAENVRGHLSLGFDTVLADLAALGYCVRWQVLRASDVGAPHRRERLFWVATDVHGVLRGPGGHRPVGGAAAGGAGDQAERQRLRDAAGGGGEAAAHADRQGPQGRGAHPERGGERPAGAGGMAAAADAGRARRWEDSRGAHGDEGAQARHWGEYAPAIRRWERTLGRPAPDPLDDRGRLNPDFAEWMMGFPEGWTVGKRTDRLRVYGNAVVPQQAFAAWALLTRQTVAA